MSGPEGRAADAPRDGGDRRPDLGEGDKAEDFGKRGEKFRELEKREKEDTPEEYKEASELVSSLAMTLSEGPMTVEKLNEIDDVELRVLDLALFDRQTLEFRREPLFDAPQLYQRYGLTKKTTVDGVTFYFHDAFFHIEPTDPNQISSSQWSLINYKLMSYTFPYLGETEDSIDQINSRLERDDAGGLSFYNPDAVRALMSHGDDFGLVRNKPTGKTYQLIYDSKKRCLKVEPLLELEGPPR